MTSVMVHHDESIFPESTAFKPERWLDNPGLDKYLVAFSKGSRQCMGINLAYSEMYLVIAGIFRRYGSHDTKARGGSEKQGARDEGVLELVHSDEKEVKLAADGFIPLRAPDAKGIKIRVL